MNIKRHGWKHHEWRHCGCYGLNPGLDLSIARLRCLPRRGGDFDLVNLVVMGAGETTGQLWDGYQETRVETSRVAPLWMLRTKSRSGSFHCAAAMPSLPRCGGGLAS